MSQKIFNTLTRQLEEFKTIEPKKVKLYQCGPTVYWTQHIGNMRAMVIADLVRRALNYTGYEVDFVRNYTDVGHLTGDNIGDADSGEDRMAKGAKREGLTPDEIANKYINIFEQDVNALNTIPPHHKPRATEYISQMIEMVDTLVKKDFAYVTPKAVYFDVSKFPDYNKLNKQKLELNEQGAGTGDVSDANKRHHADFALWFFKTGAHANALQTWPSPFVSEEVENGQGFPGWHIECSAMSKALLGETIDIHMGGIEHISIHHTNEIAQSECANDVRFVNYWMHYEHLTVDGGKMSKSDGTSYTIADLKEKNINPLALRYFFLNSHYRSKQNFTWDALQAADNAMQSLIGKLQNLDKEGSGESKVNEKFKNEFINALEEDFNLPIALSIVWEVLKSDISQSEKLATILDFDKVLGLNLDESILVKDESVEINDEFKKLLDERARAREANDWAKSDEIRKIFKDEYNLEIVDGEAGQTLKRI